MPYFVKYRSEWTGHDSVANKIEILVNESVAPTVQTFKTGINISQPFRYSNPDLLYGQVNHSLKFDMIATSTVIDLFAGDLATGIGLIQCVYTRAATKVFAGVIMPFQIRRTMAGDDYLKVDVSAVGGLNVTKNITVDRYTTASPVTTVFAWLFEDTDTICFAQAAGKGGLWHSWRPEEQAPSVGVPVGLVGVEFNPDLFADAKVYDLNNALAELFQFVYGWSVDLGHYVLMHVERFLAAGSVIQGGTRTATTLTIDSFTDVEVSGMKSYAGQGFGYYEVKMDGVQLEPVTSDNLYQPEFKKDLKWDGTSSVAVAKGLSYVDGATDLTYQVSSYVNPAANATLYGHDEAVVFIVRSTFGNGNEIIYCDLPGDIIDPVFPFKITAGGKIYTVRARYGTIDWYKKGSFGLECVVLASEDVV